MPGLWGFFGLYTIFQVGLTERRQKKEEEAARRKAEQAPLFDF